MYAICKVESEDIDSSEKIKTRDDINYLLILHGMAEGAYARLGLGQNSGKSELVSKALTTLQQKGLIDEDDNIFLRRHLLRQQKRLEEMLTEDQEILALVLEEDYGVPERKSRRLAKMITGEDVMRVSSELRDYLPHETMVLILGANPKLFLFDTKEIAHYGALFQWT